MAIYLEVTVDQEGLQYRTTDKPIGDASCPIRKGEEDASIHINGCEVLLSGESKEKVLQLLESIKSVLKDNNLTTCGSSFNVFFTVRLDDTGLHLTGVSKQWTN